MKPKSGEGRLLAIMFREVLNVFGGRWVVGGLLALAFFGLILTLTKPDLLPPTQFFGGVWYTLLLWMLLTLSLLSLGIRSLPGALRSVRDRGLGGALYRFLTSIRLAVVLIALLTLLGLISTLVPQLALNRRIDLIARFGQENFDLLNRLGIFTIFSTWYSYALVGLFVLNLGACTVKRLRASVRYARTLMAPKRPDALRRMPQHRELTLASEEGTSTLREHVLRVLRRRRFRVREQGGQILAEKWRHERFAIDVFHISLLVAIGALLITNILGYNYLTIQYEGSVFTVPGRDFQVRVDEFWSENYPGTERVMDWKTRLTILEDGREVETAIIEVNHPFTYQGVSFYQAAMGEDWLGKARVTVRVIRTEDGTDLGEYKATVGESFTLPEEGLRVRLGAFLPDFALANGIPYSKTLKLLNPAAFFEVYDLESGDLRFRTWAFAQLPEMQLIVENPYRFFLEGMTAPGFTGIEVSWDPGLPVAYGAFALMTLMTLAYVFLRHQMVWVAFDEERGRLLLGGRARKGEFTDAFERIVEEIRSHPAVLEERVPPEPAEGRPQEPKPGSESESESESELIAVDGTSNRAS